MVNGVSLHLHCGHEVFRGKCPHVGQNFLLLGRVGVHSRHHALEVGVQTFTLRLVLVGHPAFLDLVKRVHDCGHLVVQKLQAFVHLLEHCEPEVDFCGALVVLLAGDHQADLSRSCFLLRSEFSLHLPELVLDVAGEVVLPRFGLFEFIEGLCGFADPVVDLAHFLGGGVQAGVEALDVFGEVAVVVLDEALVIFEGLLVFFDLRAGDPDFVLEFLEALF